MATTPPFDAILDGALDTAEQHSPYSAFAPEYRPLFKRVWRSLDPNEDAAITPEGCELFAKAMVDAGWADWVPTDRERQLWAAVAADQGGVIPVETFAEISENADFEYVPEPPEVPRCPDRSRGGTAAPAATPSSKAPQRKSCKAEAGQRMAEAHANRMDGFALPDADGPPQSDNSRGHCTACEHEPMMQHPYCGQCSFCPTLSEQAKPEGGARDEGLAMLLGGGERGGQLMDYQCMCVACAVAQSRCCACGRRFAA